MANYYDFYKVYKKMVANHAVSKTINALVAAVAAVDEGVGAIIALKLD